MGKQPGNKQDVHSCTQLALLATAWASEGNKRNADWKGRNKNIPFYRGHDCVCRKSLVIHKNLLELMSEFGKVADTRLTLKCQPRFSILPMSTWKLKLRVPCSDRHSCEKTQVCQR